MTPEMIDRLKDLARRDCWYDDEDKDKMVYDYSGSNVGHAFALGEAAGEIMLAREVLRDMDISWRE